MAESKFHSLINSNINIKNPETGELHRTSIRLEKVEWDALRRICGKYKMSIHTFCSKVDQHPDRKEHSRTSRIRSAILQYYVKRVINFESLHEIQKQERQGEKGHQGGNQDRPGNLSGGTVVA